MEQARHPASEHCSDHSSNWRPNPSWRDGPSAFRARRCAISLPRGRICPDSAPTVNRGAADADFDVRHDRAVRRIRTRESKVDIVRRMHRLLHAGAGSLEESHHAAAALAAIKSTGDKTRVYRETIGQRRFIIVVRHLEIARHKVLNLGAVFQLPDALFERCHTAFLTYRRVPVNA